MKKHNQNVMTEEEVKNRIEYCRNNSLCFISLVPLKDEDTVMEQHSEEYGIVFYHKKFNR